MCARAAVSLGTLAATIGLALVVVFAMTGRSASGPSAGDVVAIAQLARLSRLGRVGPGTTLHVAMMSDAGVPPSAAAGLAQRKEEYWFPLDDMGQLHGFYSQTSDPDGALRERAEPGPNDVMEQTDVATGYRRTFPYGSFAASDLRRMFAIWSWQRGDVPFPVQPPDPDRPARRASIDAVAVYVVEFPRVALISEGGARPEPQPAGRQRVYIDARTYEVVRTEELDEEGVVTGSRDLLLLAVERGNTAPGE